MDAKRRKFLKFVGLSAVATVADRCVRAVVVGVQAPVHELTEALVARKVAGLARPTAGSTAADTVNAEALHAVGRAPAGGADRGDTAPDAVADRLPGAVVARVEPPRRRAAGTLLSREGTGLADGVARPHATHTLHAVPGQAVFGSRAGIPVGATTAPGAVAGARSRAVLAGVEARGHERADPP